MNLYDHIHPVIGWCAAGADEIRANLEHYSPEERPSAIEMADLYEHTADALRRLCVLRAKVDHEQKARTQRSFRRMLGDSDDEKQRPAGEA